MTKKLFLVLVCSLFVGLGASILDPDRVLAHEPPNTEHAHFEIRPFVGNAPPAFSAGGSVIKGPGIKDDLKTYNEVGFEQNTRWLDPGYFVYAYASTASFVYVSVRDDNKCGSELHVSKNTIEEINTGVANKIWEATWKDVYDGIEDIDGSGDFLDCHLRSNGQTALVFLELNTEEVDIYSGIPNLLDDGFPHVQLSLFPGGNLSASTLVADGGDNFDTADTHWTFVGTTRRNHTTGSANSALYRELSDDGDCGNLIHVSGLTESNISTRQVFVAVWYDIENSKTANPDCELIDGDSKGDRKQVFVTNLNFGSIPDELPAPELHIKYSLNVLGDAPVLTGPTVTGEDVEIRGDFRYLDTATVSGEKLHFFDNWQATDHCGNIVITIADSQVDSSNTRVSVTGKRYVVSPTRIDPGGYNRPSNLSGLDQTARQDCENNYYRDYDNINIEKVSEHNPNGLSDTGVNVRAVDPIDDNCEGEAQNFGFGWVICPALSIATSALSFMEDKLGNLLRVDPYEYGDRGDYETMWRSLRNLSTFVIVFIALFMVISTALNFGVFSNYTVKKYLPRFVAGVILIQVSFALGSIFIQVVNEVGDGINHLLLETVFQIRDDYGLGAIAGDTIGGKTASGSGGALFAGGGVFAGVLLGGLGVLGALSILYSGAVAMLMGFFFLVIRKFAIIGLLIFSPIGLVMWLLPGNSKGSAYMKAFFTLVIMYPLLIAVIALGKVFSSLVIRGGENDVVEFTVAFLAYVGGYAAIPFLAKRFSGALGQFTGTINDKSKGVFDRGKNRIEGYKKTRKEFKAGNKAQRMLEGSSKSGVVGASWRAKRRLEGGMRVTGREGAVTGVRNLARRARGQDKVTGSEKGYTQTLLSSEAQKLFEEQIGREDVEMQKDRNLYEAREDGPDNGLLKIALDKNEAEPKRQAALRRMVKVGDEKAMRHFLAHKPPDDLVGHKMVGAELANGNIREAFKEAAPDIAKMTSTGGPNSVILKGLGLEDLSKLSSTSWENLYNHDVAERQQTYVDSGESPGDAAQYAHMEFVDRYLSQFSNASQANENNWRDLKGEVQQKLVDLNSRDTHVGGGSTAPKPRPTFVDSGTTPGVPKPPSWPI